MLAIATLLTHKIYIAIATIYTHITYCRPHHLDGHSSKISQMSLQVDTINILATGVDCVPKSENAEKKLAGVYDHALIPTHILHNTKPISHNTLSTVHPTNKNHSLFSVC